MIRKYFRMILLSALLLISSGFSRPLHAQEERVQAWSYYMYPPFEIDATLGLTHEFVSLLNEAGKGRYVFEVDTIPRKRIDLHMAQGDSGVVLFVNPVWIHGPEPHKEMWSPPLFEERNAVLSNKSRKVDYSGIESVRGLLLGGVFGHYYKDLDDAVADGVVRREDATNEKLNVLKLVERRIDFTTGPQSVLRYLVSSLGVEDRLYFSPTPLFTYDRYILMYGVSDELHAFIQEFVAELPKNRAWQDMKQRYALD